MIYDRIRNIMQYKGTSENLDKAIDFLFTKNFNELVDGKNIVDGDNVFANIMYYDTKNREDGAKESHLNYIDIHLMISGKEEILISDTSELEIVEEYTKENDCIFYTGQMNTSCIIKDDYFIICFPNDGHTAAIKVDTNEYVKKMVVKVRV